ncbi:hypothetical protein CLTEP_06380 [Clostridium tepidiprofundi DSM 19306]|uniref:Chromosome partition protein Smc n=1 Tax=Clostridium tepidiprofundi DSM 19306 TaxID=1121338 RepID=A0A151B6U0_9CLOT|nr:hypothetical protein [Clostridium tepidiprofundi]KYH35462.1 hypothetical protein CLTEP_06380 [Clostridium tepidiprofundi DSM 19306]
MLDLKKVVIPSVLAATLMLPNVVLADEPSTGAVTSNKQTKIMQKWDAKQEHKINNITERWQVNKQKWENKVQDRRQHFIEKRAKRTEKLKTRYESMSEVISKGEKYVPGISDKWNAIYNERMDLRAKMDDILKGRWTKLDELRAENFQKRLEQRKEIIEKVKNGEMTKEEAKALMKEKRKEIKDNISERKQGLKQERENYRESAKAIREQMRKEWKSFKEAIKKEDADAIKTSINAFYENAHKLNDMFKTRIENLQNF